MAHPALAHQPVEASVDTGSPELIVADGRCPQLARLAAGALHPLEWLDPASHPLQAIGDLLERYRRRGYNVRTLHLLAHGGPGVLRFGESTIDTAALAAAADQLGRWGVAAVALWSCEVGADRGFVSLLAELSGATVWSAEGRLYRRPDGSSQLTLQAQANGQDLDLQTVISRDLLERTTFQLDAFSLMTTEQLISADRSSLALPLRDALLGVDQRLQAAAASSQDWLALLSGVFTAAGSTLADSAESLRQQVLNGGFSINLELRSGSELKGAQGAYTAAAADGSERIYLNADWAASASTADLQRVLLEELGHALDQRLSGGADSAGDEGALFAARALGLSLDATALQGLSSENDAGTLQIDGRAVAVEFAYDPNVADTDGDGVKDALDQDDDNDGITDIEEQRVAGGVTFTPQTLKFNYAQNTSGAASQHDAAGTYLTGDRNDPYFLFDGDINTEQRVHVDDVYEFGLPSTIGAGGTFSLTEGTGSNDAKAAVLGSLGSTDANGNSNNAAGGGLGWATISARFGVSTVAQLETLFTSNNNQPLVSADGKSILFYAGPSASSQTFTTTIPIDNIQIVGLGTHGGWSDLALTAQVDLTLDTDQDGIPNNRDLDSDNDGISDLYEAVSSLPSDDLYKADANLDGKIDSGINGTTGLGAVAGVVPVDTDADSIADFLDLDSDNDGIPDTVEARASSGFVANDGDVRDNDTDGDGVLDQFDQVAGSGGSFTAPVNTDSAQESGELNFDSTGSVSGFPVNTSVESKGVSSLLTAVATADVSKYAKFNNANDKLVVDLTGGNPATLPAGSVVIIKALKTDSKVGNQLVVSQSDATGGSLTNTVNQSFAAKSVYETKYYTLTANTRYITFTFARQGGDIRIDQIQWATGTGVQASTPDYLDLDSDQDGAADLDESGLVLTGLDADQNGADDGVGATYQDPNGAIAPNNGSTVDLKTTGTLLNNDGTGSAALDVDYRSTPSDASVEITNVEVNEGSPYAVLLLSVFNGTSDISVSLDLINDANPATANAVISSQDSDPTDAIDAIEYLDGSTWKPYASGTVTVDGTNGLLVRVKIRNDQPYEGPEALRVQAKYGAENRIATGGLITIYDDGTGDVFLETNKTGEPNQPGDTGYPAQLDDDRPVAIDDVIVNEGSPFGAVFTLNAPAGAGFTLSLASTGSGDGHATIGTDTGAPLQVSLDGGTTWSNYTPGSTITAPEGGVVYVSVPITNDPVLEIKETFKLVATRTTGNIPSTGGLGTIYDDGRGNSWPDKSITPDPNAVLDDDTPIHINDPVVNEASAWIIFELEGVPNLQHTLSLESGSALPYSGTGALDTVDGTTDYGPKIQYKNDAGVWTDYTAGATISLDANGHREVRVAVNQDDKFENLETFKLIAKTISDVVSTGGNAGIRDDGQGIIYDNDGNEDNVTPKDDDRPVPDTTAPVVAPQSFDYLENRTAGTQVATVVASDNVGVTSFRFAGGGSTSADGFYQIDNTGKITITAAGIANLPRNDFETTPNEFTYQVEAGDAAGNFSAPATITLNVLDINENDQIAPAVDPGQAFSYPENRAGVTVLGQVQASDDPEGSGIAGFRFAANGETTSPDGFFSIDETGTISLTAAGVANLATNDFETSPNSFTYAIQAVDGAGNVSAPADVVLSVTDLDDIAPVVADQPFSYFENRTAGTVVATVVATDNVGVTSYRFAGGGSTSADGFYQIDNSGKIRITAAGIAAGQATNDFETAPNTFTYQVEAGDAAGNFSAPATITLNVLDVNENDKIAPVVDPGQAFSYPENRGGVTVLGQVQASDDPEGSGIAGFRFADSGTNISADGFYAIDETGTISLTEAGVANLARNDFETTPNSFTYAIQAVDGAGNVSAPADVVLNVTDLDDTAPAVANQSFEYPENRTAGTVVATVVATDNVGVTSFRFAGGGSTSADGFYEIDNTGTIRITAAGIAAGQATNDFETAPNTFTYQVEAGDAAGNFSAPAAITLNVLDVNENLASPEITVKGRNDVSEGSNAVFAVTLSSNIDGADVSLDLGADSDTAESRDYAPLVGATAYYFDGNNVKTPLPIVNGSVSLPAGVTDFYVSVPTTPDDNFEGPETVSLTASSGGKSGSDTSTIVDDGSGRFYDDKGQPIPNGGTPDDDRPLAVSGTTVNEASPYVLWTVEGAPGQKVALDLGRPSDTATPGEDTGRKLEVLVDGAWVPYNPDRLPKVADNGELLVRLAVKQDDEFEDREGLTLTASNTGGSSDSARSFITDDGTGEIFTKDNTSNEPNQPGDPGYPDQLDDDRPLAVSGTTVNEASPYVLWTVEGAPGQKVVLDLGRPSDTATPGEDTGRKLEVLVDGAWVAYNPDQLPEIAGNGELLVRLAVKQDDLPEGRESLTLTASNTGGSSDSARSFITDDGTGAIFTEDNTSNEPNQPGDPGYPDQLDDDRPLAVSGTTVNEASPFILWTVEGAPGQKVVLDLGRPSDTATPGEDTGRKLEVLVDGAWVAYNPDQLPEIAGNGELLVRLAVKQDDLPEGRESLTLTASNTGGSSDSAPSFITDDGTGAIFTKDNTSNEPNQPGDPGYPDQLDDDRPLAVSGTTVNEASPFILWTVEGAPGQKVALDLGRPTDSATPGEDTGRKLEVLVDGAWVAYNPDQLPEIAGNGELLVRLAVKQDDLPEGRESLTLTASNTGGSSDSAPSFITDDGTGAIFTKDNTSNEPNQPGDPGYPKQLDDDRPLAVSGTTVNEASPFILWTVEGAPGQKVVLDLGRPSDTATPGEDTGRKLEVLVDGAWIPYNPDQLPEIAGNGELLVRLAVKQDDLPEGRESLTLTASNTGGSSDSARSFITDDGTGAIFTEDNTSNEPNQPGDPGYPDQLDDDRPLAVSGTTVNEASPFILWTVEGAPGQKVALDLGRPTDSATPGEDTGRKLEVLVDGAWIPYNPDQLPEIAGNGELLVRLAVKQDDLPEGREGLTLTASNTGGSSDRARSFITDDGTGAIFTKDNTSNEPNQPGDPGYPDQLDDDRPLAVSGTTVNEASPFILWTVEGAPGQKVVLDLGRPSDTATPGEDTGRKLEVLVDGAWVAYNPDQLPEVAGNGELLVRLAVKQDDVFEERESLTLTVANTGGSSDSARSFITDDGTGEIFTEDNTSNEPNQPGDAGYPDQLDDDRVFTLIGQLDSVANSGSVSDDVTADGLAKMEFSGDPGLAGFLTLNGPGGVPLVRGEHYVVREVGINPRKSAYVVELLDADLSAPGVQSFGDYYRGAGTGNETNVADGVYTLLYNNTQVVNQFVIDTNPLDNHTRLKCLEKVFSGTTSKGAFESILYGHRIEQAAGTKGDDILNGSADLSDSLSGNEGSDFLNGIGYRFDGDRLERGAREQVDTLIGGSDADYFRLGDVVGAYYLRGGDRDYALIKDLGQGDDEIVVAGRSRDYRVKDNVTVGDHSGVGIYGVTDSGRDLMAIVQGPAAHALLGNNDRLDPAAPVTFI